MFQTTKQHQDFEFIFWFFFPWIFQICVSFARHRLSAPPFGTHHMGETKRFFPSGTARPGWMMTLTWLKQSTIEMARTSWPFLALTGKFHIFHHVFINFMNMFHIMFTNEMAIHHNSSISWNHESEIRSQMLEFFWVDSAVGCRVRCRATRRIASFTSGWNCCSP